MSNVMEQWQVGDTFEVEVGDIAHGGHCVARHEGRVLFVRHSAPGERVLVTITGIGKGGRFVQADAVEVLTAAAERVAPPCVYAGPGGCGGCDFQHLALPAQRELKTRVVHEQFARLAKIDLAEVVGDVQCEALPGGADMPSEGDGFGHSAGTAGVDDGLGWRTRVEFAVDQQGRAGLRPHRSRAVLPLQDCVIAHPSLVVTEVLAQTYPGARAVDVVGAHSGPVAVTVPSPNAPTVTEEVDGPKGRLRFEVDARGFWQVHPRSAQTLVDTVLAMLVPQPGERALDLYAGVGLFAAALADVVGETGAVSAVESDHRAAQHARHNLAPWPHARVRHAPVERALAALAAGRSGHRRPQRVDVVVLDPPRVGAGKEVLTAMTSLRPRAVTYVACDPAALARDTAYLGALGWVLRGVRILDAFPMTHHVECVALFERAQKVNG